MSSGVIYFYYIAVHLLQHQELVGAGGGRGGDARVAQHYRSWMPGKETDSGTKFERELESHRGTHSYAPWQISDQGGYRVTKKIPLVTGTTSRGWRNAVTTPSPGRSTSRWIKAVNRRRMTCAGSRRQIEGEPRARSKTTFKIVANLQ